MSAYVVSKITIDALVTWASDQLTIDGSFNETPQELGQLLWHENHRSVNHRYREASPTPEYVFEAVRTRDVGDKLAAITAIEIIKLCHHLDYQSCEHPEWEASRANALLRRIASDTVRRMPGYREAPWGLED